MLKNKFLHILLFQYFLSCQSQQILLKADVIKLNPVDKIMLEPKQNKEFCKISPNYNAIPSLIESIRNPDFHYKIYNTEISISRGIRLILPSQFGFFVLYSNCIKLNGSIISELDKK